MTVQGTHRYVALVTQVGQPYNAGTVEQDVRALWRTGRFEDIQVDTQTGFIGTSVLFRVAEAPELRLRKLVVEPSTYGLHLSLREGSPLNRLGAQAAALEAKRILNTQGYPNANVDYELTPVEDGKADLRLTVKPGERLRVSDIQFLGDLRMQPQALRESLRALHTRRILAWRLLPTYSPEAVESDLARIRSLYFSKGYFDASVRVEETAVDRKDARISLRIEPGRLYPLARDALPTCPCLFAARRAAEREGILDFAASVHIQPTENRADVNLNIQRGRPYRVGRITFIGNHHYSDATLRRNLVLDEGQLFDEMLLRKSLARLNGTGLFETVNENNAVVHSDAATGIADIVIQLTEHKRGAWRLSGPAGPPSLAGPLEASISSRLPPWGAGLFELSTYAASVSMYAFAHPLLPLLAMSGKRRLLPVLALQRPFSPGEGWRSGFSFAPQLGWRALGLSYGVTQTEQRLLPLLSGDRGLVPELTVTVEGPGIEGAILCDPPPPRFAKARSAAGIALRFAGALAAF
ncbi:MAG TPA: POTRA domain-containing protein [Bryobacteraceae bacterium]|nr:POTRA domain-containing protein [Bryobacteraceae bacterium]